MYIYSGAVRDQLTAKFAFKFAAIWALTPLGDPAPS